MSGPVAAARLTRIRGLLSRPGAWIDDAAPAYPLRLGATRRDRVWLTLDEAQLRAVIAAPGLSPRPGGGWTLRRATPETPAPAPRRPGVIAGERPVMLDDGRIVARPANLGESPLAWLARRRDAQGRPFLSPAQVAAGERLRREAEIALSGASVTMRWDALPRSGGGTSARIEPGDRALSAAARVVAALDACGPRTRGVVERICIHGSSLQLAEDGLGQRRRQGKVLLRLGLEALAEHYGLG